jgi:predicted SAM-dependent methyltransferase
VKLQAKAVLSGLATWLPGYRWSRGTGGTGSARYCYSVWLRHLVLAREAGGFAGGMPRVVAELGPGDSIGIGVAALLSGAERYFALDLVRYSSAARTLGIFDELVTLFARREPIPGGAEFPALRPSLDDLRFPHAILDGDRLDAALAPPRLESIRASIQDTDRAGSVIHYHAPWSDASVLRPESVDHIYSQAVLEHIDDLDGAYDAMRRWLRPAGLMTHQVDFRCHRKADVWNGHWAYSDPTWKLIVGRRPYLLNRAPHSRHVELLRKHRFDILADRTFRAESGLRRGQLARRFRSLSDDDLTTSGAFLVAARAG